MSGWMRTTLARVAEIGAGNSAPQTRRLFKDGTFPFVRTSDVGRVRFGLISTAADFLNEEGIQGLRLVPRGTILMPKSGASTFLNHRGQLAVDAYVSSHLATIHARTQVCNGRFLLYYLSTVRAQDLIQDHRYPSLTLETIGSIPVPLPPLDEQKRIVAALDQAFAALDRARANAEANLADAKTVFDAWLTELFRERPSTWKTEKLNSLCDQITVGHVGPMADRYTKYGVPFLRSQNVRPFELSLVDVKSIDEQFHGELAKSALRPGDVAIVRTGYPGTAAAIPSSLPVSNCADLVIARPGELISPDFLVMFLNSSFGKTLVAEKSVGAAQKHFNVGAAKEAELPFPDRAEQDRLVLLAFERRHVARALAEAYRAKLSDIAELRQSLLRDAFSGQLS